MIAATYVKLQEAFISESATAGTWKVIGYMAPNQTASAADGALASSNTTNFTFSEKSFGGDGSAAVSALSAAVGWQAENRVALNDCSTASSCKWQIQLTGVGGNGASYAAVLSDAAVQLTPSFSKIGTLSGAVK